MIPTPLPPPPPGVWTPPTPPLGAAIADPTVARFKQGLEYWRGPGEPNRLIGAPNDNAAMGAAMTGDSVAAHPTVGLGSSVIPFGFGGGLAAGAAGGGPSPPPPPTGINFGVLSLRGLGGAPTGYTGAGTLTISAGNTGGVWAVDDTNKVVIAGTFGAAPPALPGPYTLTLGDGLGFTVTLPVTLIANAYHITWKATGANADNPTSTFQLLTLTQLPGLALGQTIYLRDATYNPTQARALIWGRTAIPSGTFNGSNHVVITSENPGDPNSAWSGAWPLSAPGPIGGKALINYIEMNNGSSLAHIYCKWKNVSFVNPNNAANDPETFSSAGLSFNGSNGWDQFQVTNCFFYGRINWTPVVGQNCGSGIFVGSPWSNCLIQDNEFFGVCDDLCNTGVAGAAGNAGNSFIGNVSHQVYFAGTFVADPVNFNYSWNFKYDKRYDPGNARHGDYSQFVANATTGLVTGVTYIGNIHVVGQGMVMGGTVFSDGIGLQHEVDAGNTTYQNSVFKGNIHVGWFQAAWNIQAMNTNTIMRFNTAVEDLTTPPPTTPGPPAPPTISLYACTGVIGEYNGVSQPYVLSPSPPAPIASSFSSTTGTVSTGNTLANYQAAYAAPAFGPALDTPAAVLAAYAKKAGGTLDHATNGNLYDSCAASYINFTARSTSFPI